MALNCFRYLDFKSFAEVDRLTLPEYSLLMEAVRLKQVDKDYRNHLQAYLGFVVKAEKRAGKNKTKPVYARFQQFYNYEKELKKATGESTGAKEPKGRFLGVSRFLKKGE